MSHKPKWDIAVTLMGVGTSIGLAAINNVYSAVAVFGAAGVFAAAAYVTGDGAHQDDESKSTERSRTDGGGASDVVSMAEITEASIREELKHADVNVNRVDRDDSGVWFASVETSAGTRNLDRIVGPEFDVQGKAEMMDGTQARLVPNLEHWERE